MNLKKLLFLNLALLILGVAILLKASSQIFQGSPNPPPAGGPAPTAIPDSLGISTTASSAPLPPTNNPTVKVTRVIDGDTFEIEGGQTVRLIGVDTPETKDPRRPVGCFGEEAYQQTKNLLEGKDVKLEKDVSETDKYKRLLRYVYIEETFVNKYLVEAGYAKSSSYPPDIKYQEIFKLAEAQARDQKQGLWGSCSGSGSTSSTALVATTPSGSSGCQIKGNISTNGDKIYHLPGQNYYEKTKIEENKGERWFCSESEAEAAGWRRSKV